MSLQNADKCWLVNLCIDCTYTNIRYIISLACVSAQYWKVV